MPSHEQSKEAPLRYLFRTEERSEQITGDGAVVSAWTGDSSNLHEVRCVLTVRPWLVAMSTVSRRNVEL